MLQVRNVGATVLGRVVVSQSERGNSVSVPTVSVVGEPRGTLKADLETMIVEFVSVRWTSCARILV